MSCSEEETFNDSTQHPATSLIIAPQVTARRDHISWCLALLHSDFALVALGYDYKVILQLHGLRRRRLGKLDALAIAEEE